MNKAKYNEHTTPLFLANKILKLEDLHRMQLSMFMYSFKQNLLPKTLSIFTLNEEIHSYNTRQAANPNIISRKTRQMASSFICKGPSLWVDIPINLQEAKTINSFKRQTKLLYLQQYEI